MPVGFDRGSPGKFDSRTLNRMILNRWTGRTPSSPNKNPITFFQPPLNSYVYILSMSLKLWFSTPNWAPQLLNVGFLIWTRMGVHAGFLREWPYDVTSEDLGFETLSLNFRELEIHKQYDITKLLLLLLLHYYYCYYSYTPGTPTQQFLRVKFLRMRFGCTAPHRTAPRRAAPHIIVYSI